MRKVRYRIETIRGVPVVTAPAEVDVTTAGQLRAALLDEARGGHTTIVADMTRTRFCDSAGLAVLVNAHRQALAEGGELRVVISPGDGSVFRVFALICLDRLIPCFDTLDQALASRPAAVILPFRPRRSGGLSSSARRPASPDQGA
jgi:anti-sigma B factor antagonist